MKKLIYRLPVKIAAIFLFAVFAATALGMGLCIGYLESCGYYRSEDYLDSEECRRISAAYAEQAFEYWGALTGEAENAEYLRDYLEARLMNGATNYCFYLTDETGQVVLQNFEGAPSGQGWDYGSIDGADGKAYEQRGFVREISANDDYYESYQAYLRLAPYKYTMIVWLGVLVLASVALLVFLFCSAGRRPESTGVVKNFQDRIPVDLFALAVALVGVSLAALTRRMLYMENASLVQRIFLFVPVCLGWVLLALDGAMSFATRFKAGKWWRSAILYRAAHWLYMRVREFFGHVKITWKAALLFLAYVAATLLLTLLYSYGHRPYFGLLLAALQIGALFVICQAVAQMQDVFSEGKHIAQGDLNYKLNPEKVSWLFREHARTLNNIGVGMSRAVEERLKSERMKTELITNVSHDIKTPLTSIVNYVDLLKKEQMPNKAAEEYLAVLERQSQRLKKLIEDLVEASKASTGNLHVELQLTDIAQLCRQIAGEYLDRLGERGLELIVNLPKEAYIYADGRYLFRVLDNLLGNICKYSQKNTRVYFDVAFSGENIQVSLKNISRDRLNISADELQERFVRGDSARSTEGSGLGLSIARSLTELQNGIFSIEIDGDLFKVLLSFPAAPLI